MMLCGSWLGPGRGSMRSLRNVLAGSAVLGWCLGLSFSFSLAAKATDAPGELRSIEALLESDKPLTTTIPAPGAPRLRSILVAVRHPARLPSGSALAVQVAWTDPATHAAVSISKDLHVGDPDVLWTIRQP